MTTTLSAPSPGKAVLPFNLADLQTAAAERFGLSPRSTYETAVALYERGLITYPKTEIRHLVDIQFEEASKLVRQYVMASSAKGYDASLKGPAFDTDKVGSHHGIIPTLIPAAALFGGAPWSEAEVQVYQLVHEQFLALFRVV